MAYGKEVFLLGGIEEKAGEALLQSGPFGIMVLMMAIYIYYLHRNHNRVIKEAMGRFEQIARDGHAVAQEGHEVAKETNEVLREHASLISSVKALIETIARK